jgi:OB-fold nucleic acid binding domain
MVGELGEVELGTSVRLAGWIAFKRLHKRVGFVGLRDGSGMVQVVCAPQEIAGVSRESCVTVSGTLRARLAPDDMDTSRIEVADGRVEVLAAAATLPFAIEAPRPPVRPVGDGGTSTCGGATPDAVSCFERSSPPCSAGPSSGKASSNWKRPI